ncbi:MAG: hypothetical protein M4D80_12055 [Myxococcota bacterium]|nr:hypothetical protein [Deltaproteobacteria bacterium]MDQ3335893.1 hypothetical protein [Myxococcota bacterium]
MTTRLLAAASIVLLPTIALAQAPGSYYAQPPGETAPVAPVVVVQPARQIEPMADRFAVNLNLGGFSVAPEDAPEGSETNFSLAELQLRFRATRRLEILLAFAGGRQQLDNEEEGDLAMDQVTLGLRFNFRPAHHWNWYLMAGFGSTLIAPHDTPEEFREDMRRGHAVFGIGLEHRWQHFALSAELRGVAVEKKEDMYETLPVDGAPATLMDGRELGGGQFTIGGSYYF